MAIEYKRKEKYTVDDLLTIMRLLRTPEGCPWDRAQTHRSIRGDFLEETYEAIEAIDREDRELLKEELGDVLLQVVFHSCIEEELGGFTFDEVVNGLCNKLIMRHPHVFGDKSASDTEQALENWDAVKRQSKPDQRQTRLLDNVPHALPALLRAEKVNKRAGRVGFQTAPDAKTAIADLTVATEKLRGAAEKEDPEIGSVLGELLFQAAAVARHLKIDAEQELTDVTNRFIARFEQMEGRLTEEGLDIASVPEETWKRLWEQTTAP
ncbi:MAG: nucleoside triphosphate pyrophosphohydrolase [Clostridia bacterium]|nr:nucleoside triphosphate pyrophosphohydrolase [Clostridia bacterium]